MLAFLRGRLRHAVVVPDVAGTKLQVRAPLNLGTFSQVRHWFAFLTTVDFFFSYFLPPSQVLPRVEESNSVPVDYPYPPQSHK